jgi:thymidylate kinase
MFHIAIEGNDFTGKTVLWRALKDEYEKDGVIFTREPGSTFDKFSQDIRETIFRYGEDVDPYARQFGMLTSRIQQDSKLKGPVDFKDRTYWSTRNYFARDVHNAEELAEMEDLIIRLIKKGKLTPPNILIYLTVSFEEAVRRKTAVGQRADDDFMDEAVGIRSMFEEMDELYKNSIDWMRSTMEEQHVFMEINTNGKTTAQIMEQIKHVVIDNIPDLRRALIGA